MNDMKPWVHTEMRKRRNILDYVPRTEAKLRLEHVYLAMRKYQQGVLISMRIEANSKNVFNFAST